MPFEVPEASLNISEESRNAVIRLNQRMESDVQEFILDYEYVWGVSGQNVTEEIDGETVTRFVSNGSRYSLAEMQEKLDKQKSKFDTEKKAADESFRKRELELVRKEKELADQLLIVKTRLENIEIQAGKKKKVK
jgi:hypothetical protein